MRATAEGGVGIPVVSCGRAGARGQAVDGGSR